MSRSRWADGTLQSTDMTDPRDPSPPPPTSSKVDYAVPTQATPRSVLRRASHVSAGILLSWGTVFVAIFFAAAEAMEASVPKWTIPVIGGAVALCAGWALLVRKRSPDFSAGRWIGVGIGLLHAGLCFYGMR